MVGSGFQSGSQRNEVDSQEVVNATWTIKMESRQSIGDVLGRLKLLNWKKKSK